ncbi:Bug family tripartite tricarboxylate transporter substrate binding protein [Parapusillimonas granuli]|uniref:Tripartite tricarboxylate transporter substrate binding protein n=1 Tax=Parapusillimonas granuli TaxID=380911 RepID=A0A853G619_9BURK|nr:tripartite tricarboxylate transporter substrate binding protein [Parapusillimonas granuli]MBB5217472.1 tripartite-type tricarboxylate transporter receptor subunit TctC [Parapusillimonas granuli]MEB2401749.1 tripartite tricarboxylate transporter substrate binding protein [Alcaligenaceae bacterium]NYT50036.1 tripartite tricarboxylate transporter substrate binding protein [Parapusillimonas granuli]
MKHLTRSLSKKPYVFASTLLLAGAAAMPAHAWEPTRSVEIIVPAGAGGASDQMARTIQSIILKHKLMKQSTLVLNKGGASGGEGIMETKASVGDPHKLMVAFSAIYTLPIAVNLPFNWRDLNPVAMIAQDEFVLWTNAEAPYKTAGDYLKAVKDAGPGKFKMGGTGAKREDQIITVALEKAAGVKFTYVPYKSGGEAATQLVGKHTDSNVNNPSENVAQWRADQVRALCVFSEQRMAYKEKITKELAWSDIPTCKEAGYDVQYQMLRAFFLPPKTTAEHAAYYADLLKKVTDTDEWKEYLAKQALHGQYLTGADFVRFLEKDEANHKTLMQEAGLAAKK